MPTNDPPASFGRPASIEDGALDQPVMPPGCVLVSVIPVIDQEALDDAMNRLSQAVYTAFTGAMKAAMDDLEVGLDAKEEDGPPPV